VNQKRKNRGFIMQTTEITAKIKKLPGHLIPEVIDYIDFLINKYGDNDLEKNDKKDGFKFDWEGDLSELKDQYSSVELQHKALDWR